MIDEERLINTDKIIEIRKYNGSVVHNEFKIVFESEEEIFAKTFKTVKERDNFFNHLIGNLVETTVYNCIDKNRDS